MQMLLSNRSTPCLRSQPVIGKPAQSIMLNGEAKSELLLRKFATMDLSANLQQFAYAAAGLHAASDAMCVRKSTAAGLLVFHRP